MSPDFSEEPTVRAAAELNHVEGRRVSFRRKLMLYLPLPIGCGLLVQGLSLAQEFHGGPQTPVDFATQLLRGVYITGGLGCFFLSLRAYLKAKRARQ